MKDSRHNVGAEHIAQSQEDIYGAMHPDWHLKIIREIQEIAPEILSQALSRVVGRNASEQVLKHGNTRQYEPKRLS
jgi:hypothetical protein